MAYRDEGFGGGAAAADELAAAVRELTADADFGGVRLRSHCFWSVRGLVLAALCWAWSSQASLVGRFAQASAADGGSVSYQAFMKLLVRWTGPLRDALADAFRRRMLREAEGLRVGRFHVFAADGTHLALARTASNAFYAAAKAKRNGKGKPTQRRAKSLAARKRAAACKKSNSPQMRLTTLHHPGLRLPWDWRLGAYSASERGQALEMLETLPQDALVAADCGFVGYDFLAALAASGRSFVVRAGGNVRLLRKLYRVREAGDLVHLWPAAAVRKKRPPLSLRKVVVHDGRRTWNLLVSSLDRRALSDRDVAKVYRLRWRVEVFFRGFKRTFGRAKLRSGKAEHARCEAEWSLLGWWALLLSARLRQGPAAERPATSPAAALRAVGARLDAPTAAAGEALADALAQATTDPYRRKNKCSRSYPRKKYEEEPRPPQLRDATPGQRLLAALLLQSASNERLTA